MGGILIAFLAGWLLLGRTQKKHGELTLNQFSGLGIKQKNTALAFLLSTIGIIGFPITTAFIGIDVLFTYIGPGQALDIVLLTLTFIFLELAAIRIYLRVYLGPYQDEQGISSFRSS
jgi:formate hydrogenlyase subunit 3/multisubunit Na+/H+ antiporter MnhD subunit